jgi:magnesium-protoporphyrin O-methyltransferase
MLAADLGRFDHVMAMDSLIYYGEADLAAALAAWPRATAGRCSPWRRARRC